MVTINGWGVHLNITKCNTIKDLCKSGVEDETVQVFAWAAYNTSTTSRSSKN